MKDIKLYIADKYNNYEDMLNLGLFDYVATE